MYKDEATLSKPYQFVRTRSPKKKDKSYFLNNARALYSIHVGGNGAIPYTLIDQFAFLRSFASGEQPESRYKDWFIKDESPQPYTIDSTIGIIDNKNEALKGFTNIFFDIVSPAPKILNTLVGNFERLEYDISADPIDPSSRKLIEDSKIEAWAIKDNLDFLKMASEAVGVPMQQPDFTPESQEELDLYTQLGGFKPQFARVMENIIKHTLDVSYWLPEIKKMLYRDLITLGMCACKDYYDPEDGKVKSRYVDVANFGIQWSRYPDHRDSEYGYEFKDMSISTLKQYFPDKDEDFFSKLACTYSGYGSNPASSLWDTYNISVATGGFGYDFYKVCVGDFEWIDIDGKKEVIKKNKFGREITKEEDYDKDVHETDTKVTRFTDKRMRYACQWVVGTDEVFDWGKCYDVTRPTKKEASLSYHFYKMTGKSIVQQLLPIFDNFQMLWLKYQNALSQAVNDGYAVDVEGLMNILTGGNAPADMKFAVKRFAESGWLFWKRMNPNLQMGTVPVTKIEGGMGKMFTDVMAGFEFNIRLIENITGLNPISLGQSPDPNAPVGTSELAFNATSNTLRPIISAYMTLKQQMASNVTRWIQLKIKYSDYSRQAYASALSPFDVELVKAAEGDNVQYGITMTPRATDLQKKTIYDQIQVAMVADRSGQDGGVTVSDGIALIGMLESGMSLKVIELALADRIRRNLRERRKAKQQDMEMQNKITQDQIAAKAKADSELADKVHDQKMQQLDKEGQNAVAKTAVGEGIKKDKDTQVAQIRNDGRKKEETEPPKTM